MKSIISTALFIVLTIASYSQQTERKHLLTSDDYLKKSKRQKTWAWVTTGVGVTTIVVTFLSEVATIYQVQDVPVETSSATGYYILGSACIATGITLFVASSRNIKRAKTVSVFIDMERVPVLQMSGISNQSVPALGVKISL